jgi:uncharacterized membrane protein
MGRLSERWFGRYSEEWSEPTTVRGLLGAVIQSVLGLVIFALLVQLALVMDIVVPADWTLSSLSLLVAVLAGVAFGVGATSLATNERFVRHMKTFSGRAAWIIGWFGLLFALLSVAPAPTTIGYLTAAVTKLGGHVALFVAERVR